MNYFASGLPLVEWMGSEGGRRFLLSFSGVAGGTIGTLYWLPHSILIDRTKDWLQMYDNAIPVKPHPAVIDLVAEVSGGVMRGSRLSMRVLQRHIYRFTTIYAHALHAKKAEHKSVKKLNSFVLCLWRLHLSTDLPPPKTDLQLLQQPFSQFIFLVFSEPHFVVRI